MAEPVAASTHTVAAALPDTPTPSQSSQSPRKRRRSSKQSPNLAPHPKASKAALPHEYTPLVLTGAAAIIDKNQARKEQELLEARQTSPNPAQQALGNLLAPQSGMSKLQDAPSLANSSSKPLVEAASTIKVSEPVEDKASKSLLGNNGIGHTSPQDAESFSNPESTPAVTITANGASVASPGQMDDVVGEDEDSQGRREDPDLGDDPSRDPDEGRSNKAFTYPGPMPSAQAHRTSSLPQSGFGGGRDSTRSPSTKRHKCPYCSTDFTRHHNLKSHLLTHSHEKPYSCDTCEARFRRLHDLKRHTKLHTGERPHVCPRCDRSFARGDALARHTKGQGGCAGRRSSMGSFGGDEKQEGGMRAGEGDSMPGIMYTGEASHEPEHMDDDNESPSGRSLPSIRKHEAPVEHHRHGSENASIYHQSRQPSTYPPVAARPPTGGLYPPPTASPRGGSAASTTQSSLNQTSFPPVSGASSTFQPSGPNVFGQAGMTESPKPLSPAGMTSHQLGHPESGIHRNRSPSLTQQLQHQQYGRRVTGSNTSPPMNLPPPHVSMGNLNAPQLPSLPGLNAPEARFTLQSQPPGPPHLHSTAPSSLSGPHHTPNSPSYPPGNTSSANNSLSSHSTGPHSSFDRPPNSYTQPPEQLWAYVRNLEGKVDRLQEEVFSLKQQLNGGSQQQH